MKLGVRVKGVVDIFGVDGKKKKEPAGGDGDAPYIRRKNSTYWKKHLSRMDNMRNKGVVLPNEKRPGNLRQAEGRLPYRLVPCKKPKKGLGCKKKRKIRSRRTKRQGQ